MTKIIKMDIEKEKKIRRLEKELQDLQMTLSLLLVDNFNEETIKKHDIDIETVMMLLLERIWEMN